VNLDDFVPTLDNGKKTIGLNTAFLCVSHFLYPLDLDLDILMRDIPFHGNYEISFCKRRGGFCVISFLLMFIFF